MNKPNNRKVGSFSEENMKDAVASVLQGQSLRNAAKKKGLSFQTLARYVKKAKEKGDSARMYPNYAVNMVFSEKEEAALAEYIVNCANMFYGLSVEDCCKLAYEMAEINKKPIPACWKRNKKSGLKWLRGFRKRHALTLRTAESCSLARSTSFNRHNVSIFFRNLKNIYERSTYFSDGRRVFNLDETATTTVPKFSKVIAGKGIRQVNKVTSGERGVLVTTCCIINATGQYLPPALVFPRKNFKEHMLKGAPSGSLGLASPTGWMNADLFLKVMEHFIKYSHSSEEYPSILIYDNHESHLSLAALNLAKKNGVTILTFPPHTTNKLQPLDVGLFKPFKMVYNASIDSWMMQHPGRPFTIYEVAECVGIAHEKSFTPSNIINAFKKCGIYPYDENAFTDVDFMASSVSDRANDATTVVSVSNDLSATKIQSTKVLNEEESDPRTSSLEKDDIISPEVFKGYPKALARKTTKRRRKQKSIIATDTPVRNAIETREKENEARKSRPNKKITKKPTKRHIFKNDDPQEKTRLTKQIVKKVTKKDAFENDDSSSYDEDILMYEKELVQDKSSDDGSWVQASLENINRNPVLGDFVLVLFTTKSKIYYVGKVMKDIDNDGDYEVSFLRKARGSGNKFTFPDVEDCASVPLKDVKMILPPPMMSGHTSRQQASVYFEINLSSFNVN